MSYNYYRLHLTEEQMLSLSMILRGYNRVRGPEFITAYRALVRDPKLYRQNPDAFADRLEQRLRNHMRRHKPNGAPPKYAWLLAFPRSEDINELPTWKILAEYEAWRKEQIDRLGNDGALLSVSEFIQSRKDAEAQKAAAIAIAKKTMSWENEQVSEKELQKELNDLS